MVEKPEHVFGAQIPFPPESGDRIQDSAPAEFAKLTNGNARQRVGLAETQLRTLRGFARRIRERQGDYRCYRCFLHLFQRIPPVFSDYPDGKAELAFASRWFGAAGSSVGVEESLKRRAFKPAGRKKSEKKLTGYDLASFAAVVRALLRFAWSSVMALISQP